MVSSVPGKTETESQFKGPIMNPNINHNKIIYIQTVLPEEIVKELKKRSKQSSIKEAISEVVYQYLECEKNKEEALKKEEHPEK